MLRFQLCFAINHLLLGCNAGGSRVRSTNGSGVYVRNGSGNIKENFER